MSRPEDPHREVQSSGGAALEQPRWASTTTTTARGWGRVVEQEPEPEQIVQPEPQPEPEPEPGPGPGRELLSPVLRSLLNVRTGPTAAGRAAPSARRPRPLPAPSIPYSRAYTRRAVAEASAVVAARQRRRQRGSPAAAEAVRLATGGSLHQQAAAYRTRLEETDVAEEAEPPSPEGQRSPGPQGSSEAAVEQGEGAPGGAAALVQRWFAENKLSSLADAVCEGLGVESLEELAAITPAQLTAFGAERPALSPLRLRRLQAAIEAEQSRQRAAAAPPTHDEDESGSETDVTTTTATTPGCDWSAWSPPPASELSFLEALSPALGADASAFSVNRTRTARMLSRHEMSRYEGQRLAEEEKRRLRRDSEEWRRRGQERSVAARASSQLAWGGRPCSPLSSKK